MAKRTLSIRSERLGELTTSELTSVIGGVPASGWLCEPITGPITGICPSWDCTGCHITCTC